MLLSSLQSQKMPHFPFLITLTLLFLVQYSSALSLPPPQTLFSPITKDESTNLYTLLIYLKTPLRPSNFHLDLGSYVPWYDCVRHYKTSSSYKNVPYNSTLCDVIQPGYSPSCYQPPGPGCANDTCGWLPENPISQKIATANLFIDKFAVLANAKPGQPGPISDLLFACTSATSSAKMYKGFARGSTGLAALGRFNYSIPAQISLSFSSPQIFAICLPSSSKSKGIVLFNNPGPYYFSPSKIDLSKLLIYTPLILGPVSSDTKVYWWHKSPDYYIGLTSFKVNARSVPLNQTLLAIDRNGHGGTKMSTSTPYTVLQSSIFKALRDAFVKESDTLNLTLVKPVEPFNVCYGAEKIAITDVGPSVPAIDLVLQNDEVVWRIYGWNSMVRIKSKDGGDAWCLGFVDGGFEPKTSIVIGAHQFEDNLLQFDLERERLGFSSSLLSKSTSTNCANFDPKINLR